MAEKAPNILLCTLGASWAVIPESYALLAPERLPLYEHHPQRGTIERRISPNGSPPDNSRVNWTPNCIDGGGPGSACSVIICAPWMNRPLTAIGAASTGCRHRSWKTSRTRR